MAGSRGSIRHETARQSDVDQVPFLIRNLDACRIGAVVNLGRDFQSFSRGRSDYRTLADETGLAIAVRAMDAPPRSPLH